MAKKKQSAVIRPDHLTAQVSCRAPLSELQKLDPKQLKAFLVGVGEVMNAAKNLESACQQ